MWGKDDGDYDSPTSRDETPDEKKRKAIKKRRPKKCERKREKGQCYYPFTTLMLQSSTMIFMIESLLFCHFHILVGIFIILLGLYIPTMGFLKCPRSSWASKLDAHPPSFFLSFRTLIALVHPLHGNPYSLTLISIDGNLHSPLICLVDVRLSSPFLSSPQPPFYSTYSAMSMAHAHVLRESWKSLRTLKYETTAWLVIGVVHDERILCDENEAWPNYMIL